MCLLLWQRAGRRLARIGYVQRADEGPRDFVERVREREPALEAALDTLLDTYLRLRYAGEQDRALEIRLAAAIKHLRRPRP